MRVFFIFSICYLMVLSISVHHLIIITINSEIWTINHSVRTWSNCMRCKPCYVLNEYRPGQDGRRVADDFFFFSWIKIFLCWLELDGNLITRSQSTILRHGLRLWLGAEQITNHYQNQWSLTLLTHMLVSLPHWVKHFFSYDICDFYHNTLYLWVCVHIWNMCNCTDYTNELKPVTFNNTLDWDMPLQISVASTLTWLDGFKIQSIWYYKCRNNTSANASTMTAVE